MKLNGFSLAMTTIVTKFSFNFEVFFHMNNYVNNRIFNILWVEKKMMNFYFANRSNQEKNS